MDPFYHPIDQFSRDTPIWSLLGARIKCCSCDGNRWHIRYHRNHLAPCSPLHQKISRKKKAVKNKIKRLTSTILSIACAASLSQPIANAHEKPALTKHDYCTSHAASEYQDKDYRRNATEQEREALKKDY